MDTVLFADADWVFDAGLDVLDSAPVKVFGVGLLIKHIAKVFISQHLRQTIFELLVFLSRHL